MFQVREKEQMGIDKHNDDENIVYFLCFQTYLSFLSEQALVNPLSVFVTISIVKLSCSKKRALHGCACTLPNWLAYWTSATTEQLVKLAYILSVQEH